jgi:hypothetical protein
MLGDILWDALEKGIINDRSWARYFYNLLCDPVGKNLRNLVSHGLLPTVTATREDAALLLHVACTARLLTQTKPSA